MRTRSLYALLVLPFAMSCDSITTGHLQDTDDPLTLLRIMIQDERPFGGLNRARDLLDKRPVRSCSLTDPCPVGDWYTAPPCDIPAGMEKGTCPNPLQSTPVPVGVITAAPSSGGCAGVQIRLIFNKLVSSKLVTITKDEKQPFYHEKFNDPTVVQLLGPDGKEVEFDPEWYGANPSGGKYCSKHLEPVGDNVSSDIFVLPYGPAITLIPKAPLIPKATYKIVLKPDLIVDRKDGKLAKDINGPIQAEYSFTVEEMFPYSLESGHGGTMDASGEAVLAPTQAGVLWLNGAAASGSLTGTVKDAMGMAVPAVVTFDQGGDAAACKDNENPTQINVIPVDAMGARKKWDKGEYTLDLTATVDGSSGTLKVDPEGTGDFKGIKFSVDGDDTMPDEDDFHIDNFLLPSECMAMP